MSDQQPYYTIRTRRPADGSSLHSADSTVRDGSRVLSANSQPVQYGSSSSDHGPMPATHDISRVNFHVKHIGSFAQRLEDSAARAFPNRGRSSQRYNKVEALLLHWHSDDLFVLPELEDLGKCMREDYAFDTDVFAIPSENSHLELMMRVGKMIKDHEAQDTLFVVYYGGHAKIDESRQSTWCATRHPDSPWLQWSAIQTLLERSASDVLILLDCCAGAASATFPNGSSITETISASSWDAIAPDPGRYSFTNALIEVLQGWRLRTFSAAMLHAEVLARLKHPRPIAINGKLFEARSTPVHFMMTSNHKAPSIEMCKVMAPEQRPPSPPQDLILGVAEVEAAQGRGEPSVTEEVAPPSEDVPHVMISLALEDDQRLDLKAWEQWLSAFPALAKYVKIQGVFKSHSTLLLLSMPVMIWDLLPEDHAASFVAFIRSNNIMLEKPQVEPKPTPELVALPSPAIHTEAPPSIPRYDLPESASFYSGTTYNQAENQSILSQQLAGLRGQPQGRDGVIRSAHGSFRRTYAVSQPTSPLHLGSPSALPLNARSQLLRAANSSTSLVTVPTQGASPAMLSDNISRSVIYNQHQSSRRTVFAHGAPEPPKFAPHVVQRLEEYFEREPLPNDAQKSFVASNLGIEPWHVEAWFHYRRERDEVSQRLHSIRIDDMMPRAADEARLILPSHLNTLLETLSPGQLLLVDVRTSSEFEKSHIYGAVHLRIPLRFAQHADYPMLERAFTDAQSRWTFASWQLAKCMVFYDRAVDFTLDCPLADVLLQKFRRWGWEGQSFVLKGHYREFAASYSKYIVGIRMTQEAKEHVDGLRGRTASREDQEAGTRGYLQWLAQMAREQHLRPSSLSPTLRAERAKAMEIQQRDLEVEFDARLPELARKANEVHSSADFSPFLEIQRPGGTTMAAAGLGGPQGQGQHPHRDSFDMKARMVEYLDRGISGIREGASPSQPQSQSQAGHLKLAADTSYLDAMADRPYSDEYVTVERGDELLAGDPGFQKLGEPSSPGDEGPKKGRGGILNRVRRWA